jgi:hypothetical protein
MLTPWTHVDSACEDHSQDDEELPEAEKDKDVVELVVEGKSIIVIDHLDR